MGGETLVLGIDPGSICTGWGVVREVSGRAELVGVGVIRPGKGELAARLGKLYAGLSKVIAEHGPTEAAMENVFVSKNAMTALKLGQARGALMAACAQAGLGVAAYEPVKVKKSLVGTGRAEKSQVAFMVAQVLGQIKPAWPLDASDALAVAVCHLNHRRLNRLAGLRISADPGVAHAPGRARRASRAARPGKTAFLPGRQRIPAKGPGARHEVEFALAVAMCHLNHRRLNRLAGL